MRKVVLALAIIAGLSVPAYAGNCENMVRWINSALEKNTELSEADRAEVIAMRDEGQELHDQGQHSESVTILTKALVLVDF